MITPMDIQKKSFSTAMRGYSKNEVDDFMKTLSDSIETKNSEIEKLKDIIKYKNEELKKYKTMEETMSETLVFAKQTADEIMANAKNKEELLLNQADLKASQLIQERNDELRDIEQRISHLKGEYSSYKLKLGAVMSSHLSMIEETELE